MTRSASGPRHSVEALSLLSLASAVSSQRMTTTKLSGVLVIFAQKPAYGTMGWSMKSHFGCEVAITKASLSVCDPSAGTAAPAVERFDGVAHGAAGESIRWLAVAFQKQITGRKQGSEVTTKDEGLT
jgi:hypothetical protein